MHDGVCIPGLRCSLPPALCLQVYVWRSSSREYRTLFKAWDEWSAVSRTDGGAFELQHTLEVSVGAWCGTGGPCCQPEGVPIIHGCTCMWSPAPQALLRAAPAPADGIEDGDTVYNELGELRRHTDARSINGVLDFMQSGEAAAV